VGPDPPVPLAATYSVGTNLLTVTFNLPLQPGFSAVHNWWHTTINGPPSVQRNNAPAIIAGNTVAATMVNFMGAGPPSGTCRYAPPPFDVLNLPGNPAAAFDGFPTVNVP